MIKWLKWFFYIGEHIHWNDYYIKLYGIKYLPEDVPPWKNNDE